MELLIKLPQSQSFDIEIDKQAFHSAYKDASKMFFLNRGEHTVSASTPEPSTLLWGNIQFAIKLLSEKSNNKHCEIFKFKVNTDTNIVISVEYGNYAHINFYCDEELLSITTP